MTLDDLMELTLQAGHSAGNVGYGPTELTVVELDMENNPPTLILDTIPKNGDPSIRFISIL